MYIVIILLLWLSLFVLFALLLFLFYCAKTKFPAKATAGKLVAWQKPSPALAAIILIAFNGAGIECEC